MRSVVNGFVDPLAAYSLEQRRAMHRAAQRRSRMGSRPHYVYRCYDAEGQLLYIGCSANVKRRMGLHRSHPTNPASLGIAASCVRVEVEGPFAGWPAGHAAERAAIAAEKPLLNVQHKLAVASA